MKVVYHERYLEHRQFGNHPECPERLMAVGSVLEAAGLADSMVQPRPAERADVESVHTEAYVDMLESFGEGHMDPDTYSREETFEIALLAAGGFLRAVELAEGGEPAIALVRPPGHHAGADYNCGFCYLNNVAIGAQYLAGKGRRVAIVDYDVHHGNGTNDIFHDRSDVLYVSTHQWGIFPGTGHFTDAGVEDGVGYTVNIPFTSGAGDCSFAAAYQEVIEPVVRQFRPDAILVNLGTDAHYMDPLATLSLSTPGYVSLIEGTLSLARELCGGRLAITLEGGYHLGALAETVGSVVALGTDVRLAQSFTEDRDPDYSGRDSIEAVKGVHSSYWNL